MRRGTVILLATALVFLLGCTEAGESTKVGAISGGAVGAGLGAVIGSQTGDAAGGLVIGGLAGAGAGAAVGNALDERDQAISSQDLALERQDKIIEAQKNQIDELRRLSQDSVRFKGDTSFDSRSADSRTPLGAPVVSRDISSRTLPTGSSLGQVGYGSTATQQPLAARTLPRADAYPQNTLRSFENSDARAAFQGESPRGAALATPPASLDRPSIITESGSSDLPREASSDSGDDLSRFNSVDCRNALTEHGIGAEAAEVADKLFRFRRALRLCPENPLFHVELGRTYVAMGRTDDAQYEFEEALRLDSGYEPASKELAFLKNRF